PVEPDGAVLTDHAVAIRGGRIVAVLPTDEAKPRYAAEQLVERPHHALLPGFVNAHTHAAMVLLRGRGENASLGPWLREAIWPIERRWVDPEYVRDGTELAIAEMLRAGVTCFGDMHLWPEIVARTAAELHVRASVGLVVVEAATRWASGPDEYIEKGMALRDEYRGDPLVSTYFAPHAPYTVEDATLLRIRRLADELEIPVGMHLHESAWEIERARELHGMRPLERLKKLGLASPLLVAVHMTQVEPADLDCLAAAGAAVVHCPQSNLKLGNGVCPTAELLERGVRVGLGTDGAASNNDLDVLSEMHTAGLLAAGISGRPGSLVAKDLLRMATLEGARVLGLGDATGSLVAGKWADLCCIDLRTPGSWPVHDVESTIVYASSSRQVTDTWVAGRPLLVDGTLRYLDEAAVMARAEAWLARIDADHGGSDG
ncbi:MAG TPA: TRZ/ATZ family hydrolase, partial [Steroidobacteraceae bacterium]|nr:TRZ/ATZ family hydrolase [Steroidobacteraceae bacterium]